MAINSDTDITVALIKLGKSEKNNPKWSGSPGDPNFKIADRITVLDRGNILMSDTVEEIKNSDNERIQSLLNRTPSNELINADEYLDRLTGM